VSSLAGKRVLLTRAAEDNAAWARGLAAAGAHPLDFPCLLFEVDRDSAEPLARALAGADWVALTSRRAVRALAELAPPPWPADPRLACVGTLTGAAAEELLGPVELVAPGGTARSLAETLIERSRPGESIVLPTAVEARPDLEELLNAAQRRIDRVAIYSTRAVDPSPRVPPPQADLVFFASPSAVAAYAARADLPAGALTISLGPTTSEALRAAGWRVAAEASTRDLEGMIRAAEQAFASTSSPPSTS